MKKATPALLLAGLAVSACLQAQAAEPQPAVGTENAAMVGIDAKTHQLRPLTVNEAKALQAKAAAMPRQNASRSRAPRTPEEARATMRRHANGTISMRAPLSAMSNVQATRDANGNLSFTEVDGDAQPVAPKAQEVSK